MQWATKAASILRGVLGAHHPASLDALQLSGDALAGAQEWARAVAVLQQVRVRVGGAVHNPHMPFHPARVCLPVLLTSGSRGLLGVSRACKAGEWLTRAACTSSANAC